MSKKHVMLTLILCVMFVLTGCQTTSEELFEKRMISHERLLREHFLGHYTRYDIAELINRTTNIANQLRGRGRLREANRFDSYRDVLIYGRHTIDESIRDVQKLIKYGVPESKLCFSFCLPKILDCDM